MTRRKLKASNGRAAEEGKRFDVDADAVAKEVQEIVGLLFWDYPDQSAQDRRELAKKTAEFARYATQLLIFIRRSGASDLLKKRLALAFFSACLLCDTSVTLERDAIDRYRREGEILRAKNARSKKAKRSEQIAKAIERLCEPVWKKNPHRRTSAAGTAADIEYDLNEEMQRLGRRPVSTRTIRRRIRLPK